MGFVKKKDCYHSFMFGNGFSKIAKCKLQYFSDKHESHEIMVIMSSVSKSTYLMYNSFYFILLHLFITDVINNILKYLPMQNTWKNNKQTFRLIQGHWFIVVF